MSVSLNPVQPPIVPEDFVLKAQPLQIGAGVGREKQRLAGFQIDREAGVIPLGKLEPSAVSLAKPDVVLPTTRPLRRYFRAEEEAFFATPIEERAPFPACALAFREAACIRSIWA
jgi:hypothetical protein